MNEHGDYYSNLTTIILSDCCHYLNTVTLDITLQLQKAPRYKCQVCNLLNEDLLCGIAKLYSIYHNVYDCCSLLGDFKRLLSSTP